MGITLPAIGSSAWGTPLSAALEDLQDSGLIANDAAFQAWNYPPFHISAAGAAITSGTVVMCRLPRFTQSKTISSLHLMVAAVAVTPTAGQCFAGLYDASGNRLGQSADVGTVFSGGTGVRDFPLTGAVVCPVGDYWAAFLQNAATPATVGVSSTQGNASGMNAGLTAATAFFTDGPTAQTTLPAAITMSTRTLSSRPVWAGVK